MCVDCTGEDFLRCKPLVSTECVIYKGEDIPCLNVCKGEKLSSVEVKILNKICELVGKVDMSSVVLPDCLITAWGTKDKSILNFIQFVLDQFCLLNSTDTVESTINVDYMCLASNPCINTQAIVTVPKAIQDIIIYLCDLAGKVNIIENSTIPNLNNKITTLTNRVTTLENNNTTLVNSITTINSRINCIITNLNANSITIPC